MGRGSTESQGSALLYGAGPLLRPHRSAEVMFSRALSLALGAEEESELHAFLASPEAALLPAGHDGLADAYADRVTAELRSSTPHRSCPGLDPEKLQRHDEIASFIARAGTRLSTEAYRDLVSAWIIADLRCGAGYKLLESNLDMLMERTALRHIPRKVVHRQLFRRAGDRVQASHYAAADPDARVACGTRMGSLRMDWYNDRTGESRPTCKACLRLDRSPKVLVLDEDTPTQMRRLIEPAIEGALGRSRLLHGARTLEPTQLTGEVHRQGWVSIATALLEAGAEVPGKHLSRGAWAELKRHGDYLDDPDWRPPELPGLIF